MDNLSGVDEAIEWDSRIVVQVDHGITLQIVTLLVAVYRDSAKDMSFAQEQIADRGLTDLGCIRQYGIEDRPSSPGEELMTLSTSAVAVCCWSILSLRWRSSLSRRAFSIAMTA